MSHVSPISNCCVCPLRTPVTLTVYPLITPFLFSSAGGLQISTSVLASDGVAIKLFGGPLGTVKDMCTTISKNQSLIERLSYDLHLFCSGLH